MLPLTGDLATLGQANRVALEVAVDDVNAFLDQIQAGRRVRLAIHDTGSVPSQALAELKQLAADDLAVTIGPAGSEELDACIAYADRVGVVLISTFGAAPSLALAGDYLFRFVPDDRGQAAAISALMISEGTTVMVGFAREGLGADELLAETSARLTDEGAFVIEGVRYDRSGAGRNDFSDELASLSTIVEEAVAEFGASQVAVYLVSYDEGVRVLEQAADDPVLASVRWYGSAGLAGNPLLVANEEASAFAAAARFTAPLPDIPGSDRYDDVAGRIEEALGREPDPFSIMAYDALFVAATTIHQTNSPSDAAVIAGALDDVAAVYVPAGGPIELNAAGDRVGDEYEFWSVLEDDDSDSDTGVAWTRTAVYRDGGVAVE
jgi:branched-chain amino acid transport system substrate-binding protein